MFWQIASHFIHNILVFRYMIVATLTIADIFIAMIILARAENSGELYFS